jgi:hypothetical protein
LEETHKTDFRGELDSLKNKIQNLSERYDQAEKRTSDVQKYWSFVVAALTAIIIAMGIFNVFSFFGFKKETKERIDEWIGESRRKPELVLMADINRPLEGATIDEIVVGREKDKIIIIVHFNIRNKGEGLASRIFVKTYQNPPMNTGSNSSDEKDFIFEIGPIQLPDLLPPQASAVAKVGLSFPSFELPKKELPMLVKVYYGDQLVKAKFFINILK